MTNNQCFKVKNLAFKNKNKREKPEKNYRVLELE